MENIAKKLKEELNKKNSLIELIQMLFQARDVIHLAHLKTNSYAAHVALGDFYEGILDFADELVETAQGCDNKLLDIKIPASSYTEPLEYLTKMKYYLISLRDSLEYEFQKNIVDEITALTSKTIYKLKFLK